MCSLVKNGRTGSTGAKNYGESAALSEPLLVSEGDCQQAGGVDQATFLPGRDAGILERAGHPGGRPAPK